MSLLLLQALLAFDSVVLMLLGLSMVAIPGKMLEVFRFTQISSDVQYVVAMWGCVLLTLGVGYMVAATDPVKHVTWVQVGILRGTLEAIVGLAYRATGMVTWTQASFAIGIGAFVALAYWALLPQTENSPQAVSAPVTRI